MKIKIIVGLLVLLSFALLVIALKDARADRDKYKGQVATLEKKIEAQEKVNDAQRATIIKLQNEERLQDEQQQNIRGKILKSPASDDAPAAPVLARTLDELRSLQRK